MARLSIETQSPIGSPIPFNRPRGNLPQAQWATEYAVQAVRRSTPGLESLIKRPGHPQRSSRLSARPVLDKSRTLGLRTTPSSNKHLGHTTIRKP
ncbi:hypothetical protein CRG98_001183 [Punica granatum]|uniref:Uncharacterized protein n=1 Tax=Punica granatum TaxID=22663 RepID=A0A2I0LCK2_PUNGR|nr:hypothetical protein CRG98_001183 [Punica granatum]